MDIVLTAIEKGGEYPLQHDLNFQKNRYEAKHSIVSTLYQSLTNNGRRRRC